MTSSARDDLASGLPIGRHVRPVLVHESERIGGDVLHGTAWCSPDGLEHLDRLLAPLSKRGDQTGGLRGGGHAPPLPTDPPLPPPPARLRGPPGAARRPDPAPVLQQDPRGGARLPPVGIGVLAASLAERAPGCTSLDLPGPRRLTR